MIALPAPDFTGALCAETDPELFFPERGGAVNDAKRVCRSCPAALACLQYAMDYPVEGVWGGTSVNERKALARAAGRTYNTIVSVRLAGLPTDCGTTAAIRRHQRAGETCTACRVGLAS